MLILKLPLPWDENWTTSWSTCMVVWFMKALTVAQSFSYFLCNSSTDLNSTFQCISCSRSTHLLLYNLTLHLYPVPSYHVLHHEISSTSLPLTFPKSGLCAASILLFYFGTTAIAMFFLNIVRYYSISNSRFCDVRILVQHESDSSCVIRQQRRRFTHSFLPTSPNIYPLKNIYHCSDLSPSPPSLPTSTSNKMGSTGCTTAVTN